MFGAGVNRTGVASRYSSGSDSNQMMRLLAAPARNTEKTALQIFKYLYTKIKMNIITVGAINEQQFIFQT
jgi:hypothetical protein